MNLAVLRPPVSQLLHPDGRNDSKHCRLEFRPTIVQSNVGRNAHLGDEVEVFLVAACALVYLCRVIARLEVGGIKDVPFVVCSNLQEEESLLVPECFAERFCS